MAITTEVGWQVGAGQEFTGFYTTFAAAENAANTYAPLTADTYIFEVTRYVYTPDPEE